MASTTKHAQKSAPNVHKAACNRNNKNQVLDAVRFQWARCMHAPCFGQSLARAALAHIPACRTAKSGACHPGLL